MKTLTKKKLIVSLIVLTLVPFAVNAANEQSNSPDYQLPTYKVEDMTLPVPTKIVAPRLGFEQLGQEIKMVFTVTAKGRAVKIHSSNSFSDTRNLASTMSAVLKYWEFEPARDENGIPVSVKVALPVKVVKSGERSSQTTGLALAKPSIIALPK